LDWRPLSGPSERCQSELLQLLHVGPGDPERLSYLRLRALPEVALVEDLAGALVQAIQQRIDLFRVLAVCVPSARVASEVERYNLATRSAASAAQRVLALASLASSRLAGASEGLQIAQNALSHVKPDAAFRGALVGVKLLGRFHQPEIRARTLVRIRIDPLPQDLASDLQRQREILQNESLLNCGHFVTPSLKSNLLLNSVFPKNLQSPLSFFIFSFMA